MRQAPWGASGLGPLRPHPALGTEHAGGSVRVSQASRLPEEVVLEGYLAPLLLQLLEPRKGPPRAKSCPRPPVMESRGQWF